MHLYEYIVIFENAGYVLTCQSLPVSDQITVDYDA